MKNIKNALLIIAATLGIIGGITINAKAKVRGIIYYGILGTDNKVRWTKIRPSPFSYLCIVYNKLACTITSTTPESIVTTLVDQFPPQYTILNSPIKVYQRY